LAEDIVDDIYEAAVVPERWPGLLQRLADTIEARGSILFVARQQTLQHVVSPSLAELVPEYFGRGYQFRDERTRRLLEANLAEADALEELHGDAELTTEKAVELVSKLRLRAAFDRSAPRSPRDYDALLAVLDLRSQNGRSTSLKRRSLIRRFLELSLPWQTQ